MSFFYFSLFFNEVFSLLSYLQQPQSSFGGSRRLTPVQQTHILSDIQQHQQRYNQNQLLNAPTKNFGQKTPNVLIEQSVQLQPSALNPNTFILPDQAGGNLRQPQGFPNELHVQHHTQTKFIPNFVGQQPQQIQFPQQPLFDRNQFQQQQQLPQIQQQSVFQRSVATQQGDPNNPFKPSQPFPAPPGASLLLPNHNTAGQFLQNNFPTQQQLPQTLQNQIFQSSGSQISPQQANNQFPSINGLTPPLPNPQFQQFQQNPQTKFPQQPFFSDPRLEEQRYKEILEKQKIIQKHEQFVQRQQQKHQQKVRQLHEEYLQKQRRIKEQSITNLKNRPNPNYFSQTLRSRLVSPYETGLFERAVQIYQQEHPTTQAPPPPPTSAASSTTTRTKASRSNVKGDISEDELERLLTNHREKIFTHLKQDTNQTPKTTKGKVKPTKAFGRDDLLKQLKLALADQPADLGDKNFTTMDLTLPDGQKVQVIRTTDPNLIKGATPINADGSIYTQEANSKAPKPLIDEVSTSGLVPPGSEFEVVKQTETGELQPVGDLPNKKKVTFVYLEEQNDGSFKVQGVKGNGDKEAKTKGEEVDSIISRINAGEIQLPQPSAKNTATSASTKTTLRVSPSSVTSPVFESSSPTSRLASSVTPSPNIHFVSSASPYSTLSTASSNDIRLTASPSSHYPSSTPHPTASAATYTSASTLSQVHAQPTAAASTSPNNEPSALIRTLRSSGLHAMAKYLKQSGLDSILNETGPYTVFAPSDKAFKNLLVQLGGPDRAEEKFKANPRLLSGVSRIQIFELN